MTTFLFLIAKPTYCKTAETKTSNIPKYIVPKIYSTLYLNTTICHHACLECDYIGDEKNQNCTACDINSKFKYLININLLYIF